MLNEEALRRELSQWFRNPLRGYTAQQAEKRMATLYHQFALHAEDVSGDAPANLESIKFQQALNFSQSRSADEFCRQLDRAFVLYWTDVIFHTDFLPPSNPRCPNVGGTGSFAVELSSAVEAVEDGVLFRLLFPAVVVPRASAEVQATRVAHAFLRATEQAVTVIVEGEDGAGDPITNTCGVI